MRKNNYLFKLLIGVTYLVLWIFFITDKLVLGGKWSTGMFLGGVDNWLAGGSFYTLQENGLNCGPVYGPGGLVFAMISRLLFGYNAEAAFICIGGLIAIITFWGFAVMISNNQEKRFWFVVVCFTFFMIGFPYGKSYLFEMHPDIPALMSFSWGLLSLERFIKTKKTMYYVATIILFIFAALFKANALFLYAGVALFTLTTKRLNKKEKVLVVVNEIISGILVLIILFSIEGCWYNSITIMGLHPINNPRYLIDVFAAIVRNCGFVLLFLFFLFLLKNTKVRFNSLSSEMWFYSSVLWFLFGLYGTAKDGSNSGNVEAAIIPFMPFVLQATEVACTQIAYYFKNDKYVFIKKYLTRRALLSFAFIICITVSIVYSLKIRDNLLLYNIRLNNQLKFSEWINDNFNGKNVAYYVGLYELLNNAKINKTTDLNIAVHYLMGGVMTDEKLEMISQKEKWDLIITIDAVIQDNWPKTMKSFKKLDNNCYPSFEMYGAMVDVYVKK